MKTCPHCTGTLGESTQDCLKHSDLETCTKAALKDGATGACAAYVIANGSPEAAPLCGAVASLVVDYAYPLAKDLFNIALSPLNMASGAGEAILNLIGIDISGAVSDIIDDIFHNKENFLPGNTAAWMWNGSTSDGGQVVNPPDGPPILAQWRKILSSVQTAWDQSRAKMGLPPSPVRIHVDRLVPIDPAQRNGSHIPFAKKDKTKVEFFIGTPSAENMESEYLVGPEDCLLHWLYNYKDGWGAHRDCQQTGKGVGGGGAWVATTTLPGRVEDAIKWHDPAVINNNAWIGEGPFGLATSGWPSHVEKGITTALFQQCVGQCWKYRLDALGAASAEILTIMSQQLIEDQAAQKGVVFKSARAASLGYDDKPSLAFTVVKGVALAGAVAGVWFYWPQISGFVKKTVASSKKKFSSKKASSKKVLSRR